MVKVGEQLFQIQSQCRGGHFRIIVIELDQSVIELKACQAPVIFWLLSPGVQCTWSVEQLLLAGRILS